MADDSVDRAWGTPEWFEYLFRSQGVSDPAAYFAHAASGYQMDRHEGLIRALRRSSCLLGSTNTCLLDIGCGTGELTRRVATEFGFCEAFGLDFVLPLVAEASATHGSCRFTVGSVPELPFLSGRFDLVIASEVLYYLSEVDKGRALDEIHRVLKPRGLVLVSSVLGETYFTPDDIADMLAGHFDIAHTRYEHYRLYHSLTANMVRAIRLEHCLRTGDSPGRTESIRKLEGYSWLLDNSVARWMLAALRNLMYPLLRMRSLPRLLNEVGRSVLPTSTRSNVVVVASRAQ
mgnify:CR=1 FL=1